MNEFFGTHFSQEDLQQKLAQRRGRNGPSRTSSASTVQQIQPNNDESMDMSGMVGGDTLDDIIMANSKEIQRRRSYPHGYSHQEVERRPSMMEFGHSHDGLNGFQFGQPQAGSGNQDVNQNVQQQSAGGLDMGDGFVNMSQEMNMPGPHMPFSSPMPGQNQLFINTNSPFQSMSADMMQNMMNTPINMGGMIEEEENPMAMYSPTFPQSFNRGSLDQMPVDFMMQSNIQDGLPRHRTAAQDNGDGNGVNAGLSSHGMDSSSEGLTMNQSMGAFTTPPTANIPTENANQESHFSQHRVVSQPNPVSRQDIESSFKPEPKPAYSGIYSQSGFDMLGALMKVATRKTPEIDIGKVDMSCAFVVCDISLYDCPIIYVSDIFERLTGYNKHEVKGQNCRFLQSPEGKVESGARREFVDNDSVYYLKSRIAERREAQRSLINYRKGGQPFMNLLTMIPITGEDNETVRYYVGFQVDLVEKPTSVEGKSASGLYTVDYSQGMLPRYVWQPPDGIRPPLDGGQTISRDDVSTVLSSINTGTESDLTRRMWDKVLLENTDDVVHVLSLKGLFLYLSPSSRHVLEYDASELVGTALSSVCHPSDIVPVTRELKDTSTGASVNVVFRIRRKKSGYTWFESHGSLCVEQGKGRKCIILVGRERPVYALHRHEMEAAGGIGESEVWTKLSTSGMFLFVSSNIKTLLDRAPEDLVGTSVQGLMRAESRADFGRSLEKARTGKRITHKHEILNKRGIVLQAQTTLYPGDASEGQKPTFLVGQTRLLKTASRPVAPAGSLSSKSTGGPGKVEQNSDDPALLWNQPSSSPSVATQDNTTPRSTGGPITHAGSSSLAIGSQDVALASDANIFDELKTTRCTSWQFELRQMEKSNRLLTEELAALLSNKKKRKRRKGAGHLQRDCANCHTRVTPEWRRGPSGQRDLCNSCGLRWAKQTGRVSPRTSTRGDRQSQHSASPQHSSPLQQEIPHSTSNTPNLNKDELNSGNVKIDGAAIPNALGGRTTVESMPFHKPSRGFNDGGENGIVVIEEENVPA